MRSAAIIVGFSVFAFDLLTKWWVKNTFWLHHYPVMEGFFTIQLVRNEGIAFGMLHSLQSQWKPLLLSTIAVVAVTMVCYYIYQTPPTQRISLIALGLLLGGILGNFVDRLFNRYVTDFLTLHWRDQFAWPTFNVADAAISTGVFLILLKAIFSKGNKEALACCFLLPAFAFFWNGSSPDEIVNKLQQQYENLQSFTANFEQTYVSRGISLCERGIVMMQKPGKMYWEYRDPKEKYFVADGKKTFFYVPEDRQMLVSNLNLDESDSPLLFLLGRGDIRRDFDAKLEEAGGTNNQIVLRLTPRTPQPEFSYVLLEISPASFFITKLTVVEPVGQRNEYRLDEIHPNVRIPDRQFELTVPPDIEVIEE